MVSGAPWSSTSPVPGPGKGQPFSASSSPFPQAHQCALGVQRDFAKSEAEIEFARPARALRMARRRAIEILRRPLAFDFPVGKLLDMPFLHEYQTRIGRDSHPGPQFPETLHAILMA